jgi:hypothetical protein
MKALTYTMDDGTIVFVPALGLSVSDAAEMNDSIFAECEDCAVNDCPFATCDLAEALFDAIDLN